MNTKNVQAVNEDQVRTSDDWLKLLYPTTLILDPDGWDRSDYQYSFYQEKISRQEFENRLNVSTIQFGRDDLPNEH